MRAAIRWGTIGATIFAAVALLAVVACALQPWRASAAVDADAAFAALWVQSTTRELGQIQSREQDVVFTVRNLGNRRLVLNERDLACGCGDRTLRTMIVPPQQAVDLVVTLDTPEASGPVEQTAHFTTNDPAQPRLALTVRATVTAPALPPGEPALPDEANARQ